jgi:hypothetical protein
MNQKNRIYLAIFALVFATGCNQADKQSENTKTHKNQNEVDTPNCSTTYSAKPSQPEKDKIERNSELEDKICKLVFEIPEVKESDKYIQKVTKGQRQLIIWISDTPEETDNHWYYVKASEDNGMSLVTHFNFCVNPKNLEIKYYDILNDTLISLDEWRKQLKNNK